MIFIVYVLAYIIRPWVTDDINRRYFLPALLVKMLGALALGFIYQFYYSGGDTYNYHTHGSRIVWEAFFDSPDNGLKLLFSSGQDETGIYKYSSRIPFFKDPSSYTVIRFSSFFDLLTFSAYSGTALLFGVLSFIGGWMLFLTFYEGRKHLAGWIAMATLFIPSVFFWGSGLLKDTITLACLGAATFFIWRIFGQRKFKFIHVVLLILSLYVIYSIKKYILLCYLPAVLIMVYGRALASLKNVLLKILILPFIVTVVVSSLYFTLNQIGKDDPRYNLQALGNTAKITAYDIAFQTGKDAGSTYVLGQLDGTFGSLVRLAPESINVSLFRPYLWEVNNPLMFMSALESFAFLVLTIFVVIRSRMSMFQAMANPDVLFCLIFSITFAFAVGVSTYNFGTLSRYKIPLLPFYLLALVFIYDHTNRARNVASLERTE